MCLHPQQNGVVERKNRHLLKVARSLMLSTSLPSYLWGDVILTAAHLINRMPSRVLHFQTPLNCLKESYPFTRLIPDVPFGCSVALPMSIAMVLTKLNLLLGLRLACLLNILYTNEAINVFILLHVLCYHGRHLY